MTYTREDETFRNVFKLIESEIKARKKLLISYGGSFEIYNSKNEKKLPQILFILNNYEGIIENYGDINEIIFPLARECERYGIIIVITCSLNSSIGRRVGQYFNNRYALHLSDSDYFSIFNMKIRVKPRDTLGRGLAYNDGIHEFQTASIVSENQAVNEHVSTVLKAVKNVNSIVAPPIPLLPEKVTLDIIQRQISTIHKVPIGISKDSLKTIKYDFLGYTSTTISSNKLVNINSFIDSLIEIFLRIDNLIVFFIDTLQTMPSISQKTYNDRKVNYYN